MAYPISSSQKKKQSARARLENKIKKNAHTHIVFSAAIHYTTPLHYNIILGKINFLKRTHIKNKKRNK